MANEDVIENEDFMQVMDDNIRTLIENAKPVDFELDDSILCTVLESDDIARELIKNAKRVIKDKTLPDRDEKIENAMNALYIHLGTYPDDIRRSYEFQEEISRVERLLSNEYLPIKNKPIYDSKAQIDFPEGLSSEKDYIQALECLVHNVRAFLKNYIPDHDIENSSLEGDCSYSSEFVESECKINGIDFFGIGIGPNLTAGNLHYFNIVSFKNKDSERKNYLVDCTYRQFFTKKNYFIRRIEAVRNLSMSIGTYMMMTEKRQRIAEELLSKGYIEATPENLKEYLDALIFAGRELEFYKDRGLDYMCPDDCMSEYSLDDCINILLSNGAITTNQEIAEEVLTSMKGKKATLNMSDIEKRAYRAVPDDMVKMSGILNNLVEQEREEPKE